MIDVKIHKYDEEYATKNGLSGVKEFLLAIIIGVIGLIIPAGLLGGKVISILTALIIMFITVLIVVFFIRKYGTINKSTFSVLIEKDDELHYMMITPNLRGSMFPKTFTALLAGPSATYVENKIDAEVMAGEIAKNDAIITALFDLYQKNEIKTTFDTVMYGKPVYVSKILDKNFKTNNKKVYKLNCVKDNGSKGKVLIPKVFPTFFK